MSTNIKDFIDSNKTRLPKFILENKVLLSFDKVSKVFPSIGLPNCKQSVTIDNFILIKTSAEVLLTTFHYIMSDASAMLLSYGHYYPSNNYSDEILNKFKRIGEILRLLDSALWINRDQCIVVADGRVSLKIPSDVKYNNNVIFKQNESIFRVYNKVRKMIADLGCNAKIESLDSIDEFKRFSSDNIPNDSFEIVFSSDGIEGLWDITTMSMRGIKSCQSWNGQYKKNLIGSIVDPFVGIIYLTSGKNYAGLGSKMIKRSIVRYAIDIETKKPFLLLDKMYPSYDQDAYDKFLLFIRERVGQDVPVKYWGYMSVGEFIPVSPAHKKLTKATFSYRDTRIPYKNELELKATTFQKNIENRKRKFKNTLLKASNKVSNNIDYEVLFNDNNVKSTLKSIVESPDFKGLVKDYYKSVANAVIKSVPETEELTSNEYMRRLCFYYSKNKNSFNGVKLSFIRNINKYYELIINRKVSWKIMEKVLQSVQFEIDNKLKRELKKLFAKKIAVAKLP